MSAKLRVSLASVQAARTTLNEYVRPSPLLENPWLSEAFGCRVYLKLENMHPIGSFKIRGATYRISQLNAAQRKKGVIAASAGNHAQGVAWGARALGVNALIVMPKNASLIKAQNTKALGAEVRLEGEDFDEAMQIAKKIARKTGRTLIHAFEDEAIISGQGTLGLELIEQLPDVDYVFGSVGGGGMLAGVSTVLKELSPRVVIVGCQAKGADSMVRSIKKGRAIKLGRIDTFADGIAIKQASESVRRILAKRVDHFVSEDDESIAWAVLMLLEKAKVAAEGSGAVPLASLERFRSRVRGKKVVLIVSGGNIDVNILARILDRGLTRAGRKIRIDARISDRPGSLARLTGAIAETGASVIQVIHDRAEPATHLNETGVALTLETRGPEHSRRVIEAIRKFVVGFT